MKTTEPISSPSNAITRRVGQREEGFQRELRLVLRGRSLRPSIPPPFHSGPVGIVNPALYWKQVEDVTAYYAKTDSSAASLLLRAFLLAWQRHGGVFREGEKLPYIVHPLRVAKMAAKLDMNAEAVAAALLHDLREDAMITTESLQAQFNNRVADLVEGVTELGKEPEFRRQQPTAVAIFKKWLQYGMQEIEIIILKLLDRLDNMRTMQGMPEETQKRKARETLDVYVRMADRLGLWRIKRKLEDRAFKILQPEEYRRIQQARRQIGKASRKQCEAVITVLKKEIKTDGAKMDIRLEVRAAYELWERQQKRNVDQLTATDIWRINIVIDGLDCFALLGQIHAIYPPLQTELRDYINDPLPNGHQFLQTYVMTPLGPLLVQIRNPAMYARYQKGVLASDGQTDPRTWMAALLADLSEAGESGVEGLWQLVAASTNPITVYTKTGDRVDLPWGTTVLDFARWVHGEVFRRATGALVNGRRVPLGTELKSGDSITVETNPNANPTLEWLDWVRTPHALRTLRKFLQRQSDEEKRRTGLAALAKAAIPYYLSVNDLLTSLLFNRYLRSRGKANLGSLETARGQLILEIGEGQRKAAEVIAAMRAIYVEAHRKVRHLPPETFYVQINVPDRRGLTNDVSAALTIMGYNLSHFFSAKLPETGEGCLVLGVAVVPGARGIEGTNRGFLMDVAIVGQLQRREIIFIAKRAGIEKDKGTRTVTAFTAADYARKLQEMLAAALSKSC